jgi:hypothetical protein
MPGDSLPAPTRAAFHFRAGSGAGVCRECGHRYFAIDVIEEMDRLMDAPETQERVQPVPVISLAAQTPRP